MSKMDEIIKHTPVLFNDVCQIIDGTRYRIASTVNSEVCLMNWNIGKSIKEDVLYNQRAEYGKEIVKNLSLLLASKYGKGWSDRKLLHCIRSAYTFTEEEIIYAVRTQLTWTHLRSLMAIDDELKRKFYLEKGHSPEIFITNEYNNDMERRSPEIFVARLNNNLRRGVALKS
jgi:hypothetical protein